MPKVVPHEPETFGQWLRRNRKDRGLSQEELGKRVGRTKQYISGLERAAPHPNTGKPAQVTPDGAKLLAKHLNLPPEEAMRAAGFYPSPANGDDPRRLRLVAYFDGLTEEDRDRALALIESFYRHRPKTAQP